MPDEHAITLIREEAKIAIAQKMLTQPLLELIYQQNWFNLWVTKAYGGLGYKLSEGCKLLEDLAYADGGIAWTVTLCAGANMFAGFLDPSLASRLFSQPKVCWGGSGMPAGKADKVDQGYLISGQWKYATGAPHLTHFTLNAWVYENGEQLLDAGGNPVFRSFFVDRNDVLIHYDWDTFGLECTASHSFSVDKLLVPAARAFDLVPQARKTDDPLYLYPFLTFAECTLVVNYIGMFRRFLDLAERYFLVKSSDTLWYAAKGKDLFRQVDAIRGTLDDKVTNLYMLMQQTWNQLSLSDEVVNQIATLARSICRFTKEETVQLFPHLGIQGAQRDNEINIVFRNLFTASQHALLNT